MKPPFLLFKRIKEARIKAGFSQQELAKKIGLSNKTISAYELGRAVPPSTTIAKIAIITNVSVGSFFADTKEGTSLEEIDKKINELDKKIEEVRELFLKHQKKRN